MRSTILAMTALLTLAAVLTATLALAAAPAPAAPLKPAPADVGSGRVAWFDLTTTDLPRSKEFYAQLFAWEFAPLQGTEFAVEIVSAGLPIGTLRVAEGAISGFNGVAYVQVSDLRASCQRVKELGGMIVPGFPFDLPDRVGAIALVADPAGHPIGMYSRTPLPAAASRAE